MLNEISEKDWYKELSRLKVQNNYFLHIVNAAYPTLAYLHKHHKVDIKPLLVELLDNLYNRDAENYRKIKSRLINISGEEWQLLSGLAVPYRYMRLCINFCIGDKLENTTWNDYTLVMFLGQAALIEKNSPVAAHDIFQLEKDGNRYVVRYNEQPRQWFTGRNYLQSVPDYKPAVIKYRNHLKDAFLLSKAEVKAQEQILNKYHALYLKEQKRSGQMRYRIFDYITGTL